MKRIFIILGLFIFILNSYGQQDGEFDNLDVLYESRYKGVLIEDWINDSTPASSIAGDNGLTKTGSNIGLGGTLNTNTEILGVGYPLTLGTNLSRLGDFTVQSIDTYISANGEFTLEVGGVEWVFNGVYFISDGGDTLMTNDLVDAKILANASYLPFNYNYNYSTTITDSRPGVGYFRLNNAIYSNVTYIFIDNFDVNSTDKSDYLQQPDTGSYISISDGVNYVNFQLSGALTAASSYYKYAVTYLSHSGVLSGTCKISMDLSNNLGRSDADSLYHEYSSKWLANGDTILIQDTSTYADTATYALNTPSDSLYHKDTQTWLLNGGTIPKSDSVRLEMTATNKLTTDSIYSENDIVLYSGESLELNFGGNIYTYDGAYFYDDSDTLAKKSDIPSSDSSWVSFTTDTVKNKTSAGLVLQSTSGSVILDSDSDTVKITTGSNSYKYINDTADYALNNLRANLFRSYNSYFSYADSLVFSGEPILFNGVLVIADSNVGSPRLYSYFSYDNSTSFMYQYSNAFKVQQSSAGISSRIMLTPLNVAAITATDASDNVSYISAVPTEGVKLYQLDAGTSTTIPVLTISKDSVSITKNDIPLYTFRDDTLDMTTSSLITKSIIAYEITRLNKAETDTLIMGADSATQILPAQTYIPLMDLDSIQVDKLVGSTNRDSIYIGGNLYISADLFVYGKSFLNKYTAHAYISTDSVATTSLSTTWTFLGSGTNNKFINDLSDGFTFDDDTLVFDPMSTDSRDSVRHILNYDGLSATSSVNETVYYGIFVKHVGGSYIEQAAFTKSTTTSTADVYYPGAICTGAVLWLKDGDKIQIRVKCETGTTTLSTTSFGILLKEE